MKGTTANVQADVPIVAFIGEAQVGKSSLVNALAGARLLPTSGTGAPRSQTVCEWFSPASAVEDATWRVSLDALSRDDIQGAVSGTDPRRARLLRMGTEGEYEPALVRAFERLDQTSGALELQLWAAGRETGWLPLDVPLAERDARRQVEMLAAGWPASLASCVRIRSHVAASICLVDLPGLGHDDVGGQASAAWLRAHAERVAAVVCVVGKRTPELLEATLQRYWRQNEINDRLYVVATFADHLVDDPSDPSDRERAAMARRTRAAEHLRSLSGRSVSINSALARTFCIDPRPQSRFWRKVEFDGELKRLRERLLLLEAPIPRAPRARDRVVRSPGTDPVRAETRIVQPPPMGVAVGVQQDESIESWLSRLIVPRLRHARWVYEPLRSGRHRLHLQAIDNDGRTVAFVTVYGTGYAFCAAPRRQLRLDVPRSEGTGKRLYEQLLLAADDLGLLASRLTSTQRRVFR